ncbi:MAG: ABC transporter substrate-binding protein, partial [Pseudomonadota bacterium]
LVRPGGQQLLVLAPRDVPGLPRAMLFHRALPAPRHLRASRDWRSENTARVWATQYEFPAVKNNQVVLNTYENSFRTSGVMVGFIPNLRREKFQDVRLRQALDLAFNFEELNRSIFYGQYERINSYFYGSSLASQGLPEGRELEILKGLKNPIPEEVFTQEFKNPTGENRSDERKNRRAALRLLKSAGYDIKEGLAIDPKTNEPLTIELLLNGPTFEGIALRYLNSLKRIGITLKLRVVDSSQFIERVRNREFDIMYAGWGQSLSLGNEQLDYFGSDAADKPTSRNYGGIKNPAIDELIQLILKAKDRAELVAVSKAYDRVLLWNRYLIPGWTLRSSRIARWDKYAHPDPLPEYAVGFPTVWWYDEAKAAKIKQ